jgi:SpoVK/Ycf46/Vps4 family AAA+-type ATPase
MQLPEKPVPQPVIRDAVTQPREAPYEHVPLPHDAWRQFGKNLVLPYQTRKILLRYTDYRLTYGATDGCYGVLTLNGPPGTGKSDTVRWVADTTIRMHRTRGNAVVIHADALVDQHLGNSQKLVAKLFADLKGAASRSPLVVILDDAETLCLSRAQSLANGDPSDVSKATTALFQGIDKLRFTSNALLFFTMNMEGVVDRAIASRSDLVLPFRLPTTSERRTMLKRRLTGGAGERVLEELTAAPEGKSGRELSRITMLAYVYGSTRTREDLTEADYLRAVGLLPPTAEPEGTAEVVQQDVNTNGKVEGKEPSRKSSANGLSPRKRWRVMPFR